MFRPLGLLSRAKLSWSEHKSPACFGGGGAADRMKGSDHYWGPITRRQSPTRNERRLEVVRVSGKASREAGVREDRFCIGSIRSISRRAHAASCCYH